MKKYYRILSILIIVTILFTALHLLVRKGYRYAVKRNNSYSASREYQKFYNQKDTDQTCRKIATGTNTEYSSQELNDCKQRLNFDYGFPLKYQHVDFQSGSSLSRPVYVTNFVIIIATYLSPIPLLLLLLRKIAKKQKKK